MKLHKPLVSAVMLCMLGAPFAASPSFSLRPPGNIIVHPCTSLLNGRKNILGKFYWLETYPRIQFCYKIKFERISHNPAKEESIMRITRIITLLLVGMAVAILPACQRSSSEDDAAATLNPLYTQQALTVAALSTLSASTPKTPTPIAVFTPTPLPQIQPTQAVSTPIPGGLTGFCDAAQYVADVTIPDNTVMSPNFAFTKTWRLKNVGTCTWATNYRVDFDSGNPMSAVYPVNLPNPVAPGQTVDVSVNMVAPATAGSYQGNWELKNASGTAFGIGSSASQPFWVKIIVSGSSTPGACTDLITFVSDVSVPDNTNFGPNTSFTKTWRLKNSGTCTWTTDYVTTFLSGDPMSAVYPAKLPAAVPPGSNVDVSVNMVSPAANGTYKGNWSLKNPTGRIFGLGANGDVPFWVQIVVGGGSGGTQPTTVPGSCLNKAAFVSDVTVPDNTVFNPNTSFSKTWKLKNIGSCTWSTDYSALGDDHADVAAALALDAHRGGRRTRDRALEQPGERREQLPAVDRAPGQLQVDPHVLGDRRRGRERVDELGGRVDRPDLLVDVVAVAQRLDPTRGRARPDRDQERRVLADLL